MTPQSGSPQTPGALVISLDLELGWGNIERLESDPGYLKDTLGARAVVPALLELFEEYQVSATWAVVGYVFGDDRGEWRGRLREGVDPGSAAVPVPEPPGGWEESENPARVGPSLIRDILRFERHEIATHTFSHLHCLEPGNTAETLRSELQAARAVADRWKLPLRSVVFPRNQHASHLDDVLREEGVTVYRGNPDTWMWRFRDDASGRSPARRAARLLDAYLPVLPPRTVAWSEMVERSGLVDAKASFFLRPVPARGRAFESLRAYRLRKALRAAARTGEVLHLWWHPHNFAGDLEANLAFLRGILAEYERCRERWGMQSLTMAEVGDRASGLVPEAVREAGAIRDTD